MSGGGSGRGSGRVHFRSTAGCCICGTKSSSSRFTASQRYADNFTHCFGPMADGRSGDLCNACVLCVKRWMQRGRQSGLFSQVVDSKRGPGPKHMKEITKRARRREARVAASSSRASSASSTFSTSPSTGHHFTSTPINTGSGCGAIAGGATGCGSKHAGACCILRWANTHDLGLGTNNNNSSRLEGATRTRAAAARQLEAANALANADLIDSYSAYQNDDRLTSPVAPYPTRRGPGGSSLHSSKLNGYNSSGFWESNGSMGECWNTTEGLISEGCSQEFREPPPLPPPRIITRAAAESSPLDWSRDSFSTASSTPPSTPNRRQNRRTQLPPIRMSNSVEVDALLRQIMQSNSQAINFDKREMHMAVQRELRLRSRIVNAFPEHGSSASLSGCCSSSIDYASEFSSIENGCGGSNDDVTTTRNLRRS